jgi:hypothetical protein
MIKTEILEIAGKIIIILIVVLIVIYCFHLTASEISRLKDFNCNCMLGNCTLI